MDEAIREQFHVVLVNHLLGLAKDGVILSKSMDEHFAKVVPIMNELGATRHGSTLIKDETGHECIFDIYTLPDGQTFKAGYP